MSPAIGSSGCIVVELPSTTMEEEPTLVDASPTRRGDDAVSVARPVDPGERCPSTSCAQGG